MTWLRRIGWLAVAVATLAVALGSFVVRLPEPKATYVIDRGQLSAGGGEARTVSLPVFGDRGRASRDDYRFTAAFTLPTQPQSDLFLLVPTQNRHFQVKLNGQLLFDSESQTISVGPAIGSPVLVLLPRSLLVAGKNELTLVLRSGDFFLSLYLPKIYIGSQAALAPAFNLRLWIDERFKTMSLAAHVLLVIGVVFAYFYRPQDTLLSWLAGLLSASIATSVGLLFGFNAELHALLPYLALFVPAVGLLGIGVACCVADLPPPRTVGILAMALPGGCMLLIYAGIMPPTKVPAVVAASILVTFIVGSGIIAWGAFWRGATDARLMLPPYFLFFAFVLRDALLSQGLIDRELIAVSPYIRPFFLISVIAVLMRRLVTSLDGLDRANENLTRRLEEQEAQLATLHRAEQIEAAQLVREQERLRLTRDLHDGLSGHLVSIIAMTEDAGAGARPVELAARRALDDLRLVIYSLDLGDQDLPLALANFRERLVPQLQRAGVELDWSTAGLAEVSGVTPSNALSILRILQEALTNALKHGSAHKITVRGGQSPEGRVAITIENDGAAFAATGRGFGLANMQRRASELHGDIRIAALDQGTRVTLLLPTHLPDMGDATPNEMRSDSAGTSSRRADA